MKKFITRLLSFFLDLMLLSFVVSAIANMPFFDGYASDISLIRSEAKRINDKYNKLNEEIDNILDDALVSDNEFNYIHTNFFEFRSAFEELKPNTNIEKKYMDSVHEKIDETYRDMYNDELFRVARASRYENVIAIVLYLLYFGLLQFILKGQTIFKKLFRLRVVGVKETNKRIPLWKYILRAILICDIIFITADLIAISNLGLNNYLTFNGILGNVRYFYEVAFILILFLRDDQRSVHDLLLGTKVIKYNKDGKIIKDVIFKNPPVEEKSVKEEVKAIKVND